MSLKPDFPEAGKEYDIFYNYVKILNDNYFYKACTNTLKYSGAVLTVVISLSLFLSFILKNVSSSRLRYFYLFCLLLPGLIPPSVMGILFNLTFNGRTGILNQVFVIPFVLKPVNWIGDPSFIMPSMVIQAAWRWTGFITLFILCGLEALPKDVKEAAVI
ncbi:MAG: sugar ABC transporter permease, partial [Lentisphaeraceae bacterium]|nr:sugar ABC transporter permease [Lentisphaeraceae bacterium]